MKDQITTATHALVETNVQLIEDMPAEKYHGLQLLSNSGLKIGAQSWAHFQEQKKNPFKPTKAMEFGTAFHLMMEHRFDWQNRIVRELVMPDEIAALDGRKPDNKKIKDAFKAKQAEYNEVNAGKLILDTDDYDKLVGMFESLINDPAAAEYITGGKPEVTALWSDPETGAECKARFDYLVGDVIVDYKTTEDASAEAVSRAIGSYKLHWQSAFYLDALSLALGRPVNKFVHIFVEKSAPYGVQLFCLDDATLDLARQQYRPLIRQYAECKAENFWPGYPKGLQMIAAPAWEWSKT